MTAWAPINQPDLVLGASAGYPALPSATPIASLRDAKRTISEVLGVRTNGTRVIPPFLGAFKSRGHAACARRCFGV